MKIFSPLVKPSSRIVNLSTCANGTSLFFVGNVKTEGARGTSIHEEIASDFASANPHIILSVHQDYMPHRVLLLTTRTG